MVFLIIKWASWELILFVKIWKKDKSESPFDIPLSRTPSSLKRNNNPLTFPISNPIWTIWDWNNKSANWASTQWDIERYQFDWYQDDQLSANNLLYKALKIVNTEFKMGNYIGRVEFLNRKDKNHRIKAEFYKDDQIFAGKYVKLTKPYWNPTRPLSTHIPDTHVKVLFPGKEIFSNFAAESRSLILKRMFARSSLIFIKTLGRKRISYQHRNSMCSTRQIIVWTQQDQTIPMDLIWIERREIRPSPKLK